MSSFPAVIFEAYLVVSTCLIPGLQCDEEKPVCGRCVRTGQSCSLNSLEPDLIIVDGLKKAEAKAAWRSNSLVRSRSGSEEKSSSSGLHTSISPVTSTFNITPRRYFDPSERDRLRLMHHYDRYTCETIADLILPTPEGLTIMRHYVPEMAFEHDFLLHGMLGLSSLHLALLSMDAGEAQARDKHIGLAMHHHTCAIQIFNQQSFNITGHNVDALFIFSGLIVLYAFGFQRVTAGSSASPLDNIVEMLTLLRGTGTVAKTSFERLINGRLSPLFRQMKRALAGPTPKLSERVEDVLAKLLERVLATASPEREVYVESLAALRLNIELASAESLAHEAPISTFPVMLPAGFLQVLATGEPLALSMVANYGVILHWLRGNIWLAEWGRQTAETIQAILLPEWQDCQLSLEEDERKYRSCDQRLQIGMTSASIGINCAALGS